MVFVSFLSQGCGLFWDRDRTPETHLSILPPGGFLPVVEPWDRPLPYLPISQASASDVTNMQLFWVGRPPNLLWRGCRMGAQESGKRDEVCHLLLHEATCKRPLCW